jgi:hypothetical protein
MIRKGYKVWGFDCEGEMHTEVLNTYEECKEWLENHGLEEFDIKHGYHEIK